MRRAAVALWCVLTSAQAQEVEQEPGRPELDFLEYLGTWAGEDDEWLAIEEWERDNGEERGSERDEPERKKDEDDERE